MCGRSAREGLSGALAAAAVFASVGRAGGRTTCCRRAPRGPGAGSGLAGQRWPPRAPRHGADAGRARGSPLPFTPDWDARPHPRGHPGGSHRSLRHRSQLPCGRPQAREERQVTRERVPGAPSGSRRSRCLGRGSPSAPRTGPQGLSAPRRPWGSQLRLGPSTHAGRRGGARPPWSLACEVSETFTASWLLKELTPIMPPWAGVLPSAGIWLWLRGTLYSASAMSAARFRMISCGGRARHQPPARPPPLPPPGPAALPRQMRVAGHGPCVQTTGKCLFQREELPSGR